MSGRGGRGGRYRQRNAAAAANASFFSVLAQLLPPPVRKALQKPAAPVVAFALVALVDVAVSASLFTAVMAKTGSRPFFRSLTDFRRSAADVLLLCLFRLVALASLSYAAAAMQSKSAASSSPAGFVELREPTADVEAGAAREEGKHDARRRLALRLTAQAVCAASQVLLGAKAVALPPMPGDALRLVVLVLLVYAEKAAAGAAAKMLTPTSANADATTPTAGAGSGRSRPASAPSGSARPGKLSTRPPPSALYTDAGLAPRSEEEFSSMRYLRWCLGLARGQGHTIALGLVCMLGATICDIAVPQVTGAALNAALAGNRPAFMARIRTIVALLAVSGGLGGCRGLLLATTAAKLLRDLSVQFYAALLRQDVSFYDAASSGDLLSRLSEDAKAAIDPASWLLSALLRNVLQAVGSAAFCLSISWRLSLLVGSSLGPVYALSATYASYSARLQKERADAMGAASATAGDALGNIRLVRACSTEDAERRRYRVQVDAAAQLGIKDARAFAATITISEWVTLISTCVLLGCGGDMIMAGTLTVGSFIAFQQYYNRIDASWQSVVNFLQTLTAAAGSAERILAILSLEPLIGARGGFGEEEEEEEAAADGSSPALQPNEGAPLPPGPLPVSFQAVSFTYVLRPESPVLRQLTLDLPAGLVAALVGSSGAGKSTCIAMLLRLYDPQAGTVRLGGVDLRGVSPRVLHSRIGLVAQDSPVFAASLRDNVCYGLLAPASEAEMRAAAASAGALEFIDATAGGFETVVGERGIRLSGGQRQRIALARAMLRRPSLMLLDEATSSLDAESEAVVQAGLDAAIALGEQTAVVVAHRLSTVRGAATIAVLRDGALAEKGTHAELIAADGQYARLVARQLGTLDGAA